MTVGMVSMRLAGFDRASLEAIADVAGYPADPSSWAHAVDTSYEVGSRAYRDAWRGSGCSLT